MDLDKMASVLTPEIVEQFKRAIEIGKWPDGQKLSPHQLETCMQAVIAFEHKNVNENERTGYVPPKDTPCDSTQDDQPLTWK